MDRVTDASFEFSKKVVHGMDHMSYSYDAYGNILNKSDEGDYTYDDPAHPNRLTKTSKRTFEYDAVGNMVRNGNTLLEYNAANKSSRIHKDGIDIRFAYDMNDNRFQKITDKSTTTYIGKTYEHIDYDDYGYTEDRYMIYAQGRVVAVSSQYHGSRYENLTRYLHHDALGSVDTITNNQGEAVERSIYKPFGEHRGHSTSKNSNIFVDYQRLLIKKDAPDIKYH